MTTGSGNNDETEEDDTSQKTPLSLASSTISDDANEGKCLIAILIYDFCKKTLRL